MERRTESLYEILGVTRDATAQQVDRAYRRIVAEMQRETAPPDPRRRVLIEHAHDVLMDPVRREDYDRQRRTPQAALERARRSPATVAGAFVVVAAAGAVAWLALREDPRPTLPTKPRAQVENAVASAVGRVQRTEVSGTTTPLGLAFAIDNGTLVTSCTGLSPDAELGVRFGTRVAPVRVSSTDEPRGLCTLAGANVGSWPLPLAFGEPATGDAAYVVRLDAKGDIVLADAQVKGVRRTADARVFDAGTAPRDAELGAPLLDLTGRVVAAAAGSSPAGYVSLPPAWAPQERPKAAPPPAPAPEPAPEAKPAVPGAPAINISPERRERLDKAFHPPPNIPDDI